MATQIERLAARPTRATGARLLQRPDDGVWLLERNGCYLQLSPAARTVWQLCDGERTWAQIAARYREESGSDASLALDAFAKLLEKRGFTAHAEASDRASLARTPAAATEAYVTWSSAAVVERLYALARSAFRPFAVAALAVLALAGAILFVVKLHPVQVHGLGEQCALALALFVSVVIHEAGHALTLRHFGGTVRRVGFGWYWFTPVAFVDTSDAYALVRGKRIAVSLAGPFASLVVAGCASLFAAFVHVRSAESIAWSLAAFTYVATLWNFNPLLELDGYYVLADLLQRPNLRRDGFAAVSGRRRDPVALAYALGALAYGATVLFVTVPSVARMTIVVLPATLPEPVRSALPIAAAVAATFAVVHPHRGVLMQALRHAAAAVPRKALSSRKA